MTIPSGTIPVFSAGGGGPGTVLQSIYKSDGELRTTTNTIPFNDTIPQITEGGGLSTFDVNITPASATNFIEIRGSMNVSCTNASSFMVAIFKDGAADAIACFPTVHNGDQSAMIPIVYRESAGTTNEISYTFRIGSNAGTVTTKLNGHQDPGDVRMYGGVVSSAILVKEIQG